MNKRISILLSLLVLTSILLTACGAGNTAVSNTPVPATEETTQTDNPTTNSETPAASTEKISLKVWGHQSGSFNEAQQKAIDAFMAENPNVEVKLETFPWDVFIQTIQTSIPAGNAADVIVMPGGFVPRFAKGGQLLEVPADILSVDKANELYFAAPLGAQTLDGKLYGFPLEYNLEYGGAYVNPAMFKAAGLTYPPVWKTWDDVVADAAKLKQVGDDGVMTVAGLHYTNNDQLYTYFLSGILEQNGTYRAEDGKHFNFNTPEAIATIQKMVDMTQKDQVVDPIIFNAASEWVGDSFAQGHNGIAILGSWYAGEVKKSHPELAFDYVGLPPMMGPEHKFTSTGGWGIAVSKSTANSEMAMKLAYYMAQTKALEFNSITNTIPALKSVANDPQLLEASPFLAAVLPILGGGVHQGDVIDASQLEFEIIYPNILDALQGLQTAEEAAKKIDDMANAMVDAAE